MWVIVMYSDEYGEEEFRYDTEAEAREGFNRLKKKCIECRKVDKICRDLTLIADRWADDETEEEDYG